LEWKYFLLTLHLDIGLTTNFACLIGGIALVGPTVFLNSRRNGELWTTELTESEREREGRRERERERERGGGGERFNNIMKILYTDMDWQDREKFFMKGYL
jgi:hypothetical protein